MRLKTSLVNSVLTFVLVIFFISCEENDYDEFSLPDEQKVTKSEILEISTTSDLEEDVGVGKREGEGKGKGKGRDNNNNNRDDDDGDDDDDDSYGWELSSDEWYYDLALYGFELPSHAVVGDEINVSGYIVNEGNIPYIVPNLAISFSVNNGQGNGSGNGYWDDSVYPPVRIIQPDETVFYEYKITVTENQFLVSSENSRVGLNTVIIWPALVDEDANVSNHTIQREIFVSE